MRDGKYIRSRNELLSPLHYSNAVQSATFAHSWCIGSCSGSVHSSVSSITTGTTRHSCWVVCSPSSSSCTRVTVACTSCVPTSLCVNASTKTTDNNDDDSHNDNKDKTNGETKSCTAEVDIGMPHASHASDSYPRLPFGTVSPADHFTILPRCSTPFPCANVVLEKLFFTCFRRWICRVDP